MKRLGILSIMLITIILLFSSAAWSKEKMMQLISSGQPLPVIVISGQPTEPERFAAEELALYLQKITGSKIQISSDKTPTSGKVIAIGKNKLNADIDSGSLDAEEYIIRIKPNIVSIVGGRKIGVGNSVHERGILYGVYDLLDGLGVRWYRPEPWGEYVPKLVSIELPLGTKRFKPVFSYRCGFIPDNRAEGDELLWTIRNRQNSYLDGLPSKYGGFIDRMYGHSFNMLIPPEEYFEKHPEYFALCLGKRTTDFSAQLCLSNPDVQRITVEKILELIKKNPTRESWAIEPNDSGPQCECDNCKAMDDPKQMSPWGMPTYANRLNKFRNIVAVEVAKKAPGYKIAGLAYLSHTEAPDQVTRFEPNIIMQICSYLWNYSDYSKKLNDPHSRQNSALLNAIKGYTSRCNELTTYEYWEGFMWHGPFPAVNIIADRMREYHKLGVKGTYNETGSTHWGPQGLMYYMYSRLVWNPDIDVNKELDLYYKNYYGPAASPIKKYHELLEDASAKGYWGTCGFRFWTLLNDDLINKMGKYMEQAQSAVKGNELYEKRLRGVWAGCEYTRLRYEMIKYLRDGCLDEGIAAGDKLQAFITSFDDGSVFDYYVRQADAPPVTNLLADEIKDLKSVRDKASFKNPSPISNLDNGWKFMIDPKNTGDKSGWSSPMLDDSRWNTITALESWENQGYPDHRSISWYRHTIDVPVFTQDKRIILYLGGVDGHMDLWVNGRHLTYLLDDRVWWDRGLWFDITDSINPGSNALAIKIDNVNGGAGLGGLWNGAKLLIADMRNMSEPPESE